MPMPKMKPVSTLSERKLEIHPILSSPRAIKSSPAKTVITATSCTASVELAAAMVMTAAPVTAAMVELGPVTTWREVVKMG